MHYIDGFHCIATVRVASFLVCIAISYSSVAYLGSTGSHGSENSSVMTLYINTFFQVYQELHLL